VGGRLEALRRAHVANVVKYKRENIGRGAKTMGGSAGKQNKIKYRRFEWGWMVGQRTMY
jgi:hypothetical protein